MPEPDQQMSSEGADGFFLSRQPIVAGERRLIGWELTFGNAAGARLSANDGDERAYLSAVSEFVQSARWDSLLCGGRALLPVNRRILFSDVVESLPRNRVLLGLSRVDEIDANLSNRLHDLHARRGARLLFFDYARKDAREQLLDLADAVEIDAFSLPDDARSLLIRRAQRRNLQVLAKAVDGDADFLRTRDSGFELFSGRSYAQHSQDVDTRATREGRALLQLVVEARGELEIEPVAKRIGEMPTLTEGLLRLVNSLDLARAQKIESVQQALIMIGAKGLSRWLNLLLFQTGSKHGTAGPLFRVAASRARLMELLIGAHRDDASPERKAQGDAAFLAGIFSLVHVLLGVDRETAIRGLVMPSEIRAALLEHEGELGGLLRLAECLDEGAFAEVAELAQGIGVAPRDVWAHQLDSYDWVARMI